MLTASLPAVVAFAAGSLAGTSSFTPLAPGFEAVATRLSADGSVITGAVTNEEAGDFVAAVFRPDGSVQLVDTLPSVATDCSPDGSIILGRRILPGGFFPVATPCLWSGPTFTPLDFDISVAGFSLFGEARGISDDGATIALYRYGQTEASGFRGFADGSVLPLDSANDHYVFAASPSGGAVAGYRIGAPANTYATVWNGTTGAAVDLISGTVAIDFGEPLAYSADGAYLVGLAMINAGALTAPYRADLSGNLGILTAPMFAARAHGASLGGRAVVGADDNAGAFVWNPAHGARLLKDVLISEGVDMTGWMLFDALDISNDGTKISGNASLNGGAPVPFIAVIAPPPCAGDANADGFVNLADIAIIIQNWADIGLAGGRGDLSANGTVDLADIAEVLINFSESCEG